MEVRKINTDYQEIATRLIETLPELEYINDSRARIAYLESNARKVSNGKHILGECEKVQPKNQWAINYDFTITLYTDNIKGLSDKQIEILLEHELLHIGIDLAPEGGEDYTIKPHDLMDFKYGVDWDSKPE